MLGSIKRSILFVGKFFAALVALVGQVLSSNEIRKVHINSNCKIAILINFGIGNVLMVSPILQAIKSKYPESHITVIGEKSSLQIIKYSPYCDKFYYLKTKIISNIIFFSKLDCDVFFCAFPGNSFKTAVYGLLSSAPIRIGYSYPTLLRNSSLFFTHHIPPIRAHIVEKNIELLTFLNIRVNKNDRKPKYYFNPHYHGDEYQRFIDNRNEDKKNMIAFHVGAAKGGIGRRWSLEKFDELASLLEDLGSVVLIFIGPDELNLRSQVENFTSNCIIIEGISLDEVARLLQKCEIIISNDSSLMHIAAAVSIPSIGLYGPTDPLLSSPYGAVHEAVTAHSDCSPCYTAEKPLSCKIDYKCMQTITVQDVLKATEKFIHRKVFEK
ncbi:MAG: glycosyltransferase family 9 protein [Candidatus Cloacimonetes bacterium]|nr:glycosyltransferase family 9 protein [Candidatus Cloacimonadota bacterium]